MGIQSSLYSGISGLATHGNAMSVIGNNIANTNTTGFKTSRSIFADLLSSTVSGSGGESQVGRGVGLSSVDNIFSQGTFESTESQTDLAVEGPGFFMMREPSGSEVQYSRAGAFRFNESGALINAEGYFVQGYYLDNNGNPAGDLQDLQVVTATSGYSQANPTETIELSTNLNSKSVYNTYNATVGTATMSGSTYNGLASALTDVDGLMNIEGTTLTIGGGGTIQQNSAKNIAAAINSTNIGVTATTQVSTLNLGAVNGTTGTLNAGELTINGVSITGSLTAASTAAELEALIDAQSNLTSVTADVTGGSLILQSIDGTNIVVQTDGSAFDNVLGSFSLRNAGVAEVSTLTLTGADPALLAPNAGTGQYFTISSPDTDYYVWYTDSGDAVPATDPAVAGRTGIQVDLNGLATDAQVATATAAAINALADFAAPVPGAAVITVTNASGGDVTNVADGTTGLTFAVATPGTWTAADRTEFADLVITRTGELAIQITPALGLVAGTHGVIMDDSTTGADATFDAQDPINTSSYATSLRIFDSLGDTHLITNYFRKMDPVTDPLKWEVHTLVDGSEIKNQTAGTNVEVGSATLTFDSDGQLTTAVNLTTNANALKWVNNSTQDQQLIFSMNTTQYASDSVVNSQEQDGYAAGTLVSVDIDTDGYIYGKFSNGEPRALAQLALASFNNPQGLSRKGNNLYAATTTSGAPVIGTVGSGVGKLFTNSLEQSNVDLAQEFVKMITIQRGFQANSKIITTTDEMMNDLINLKR